MKVERQGLGYLAADVPSGVSVGIDRLYESRGELTGELTVTRAPEGHLLRGRFNVSSMTTRTSTAKILGSRSNSVDWTALLEQFCVGVLDLERAGTPFVLVGRNPMRPEPPYFLKPVLFERMTTILFGAGGVGKSTALAAAIVVSVASGKPAFDGWTVAHPGAVLVLDWESSEDEWNDAVAAIARGMGIEPPLIHYRRCAGPLDAQVHETAAYVQVNGILLTVVDSVTWALRSQREGSGVEEPIKRLFDALRLIGTSNLLIDHVTKATAASEDDTGGMPYGGVVKVNAARSMYELRQAGESDSDGTRHLALIHRKVNPAARQDPVGIQVRRADDGALVLAPEPVRLEDPVVMNQSGVLWKRIRDLLGRGQRLTARQIVATLDMGGRDPLRQAEDAMKRKAGIFNSEGKNRESRKWFLIDSEHAPEHAPGGLRSISGTPLGGVPRKYARPGSPSGFGEHAPASEDRWQSLIDLADRQSTTSEEDQP